MNDIARLRWRCRRGTRELDLLLQRFLDVVYPTLTDQERRAFERLLDEADPDLLDWITGRRPLPAPDYEPLIAPLRQFHAVGVQ